MKTPKKFQPPQYGAKATAQYSYSAASTPVNKNDVLSDLTQLAEELGIRTVAASGLLDARGPKLVLDLPRDFNTDMARALSTRHDAIRGVIVSLDCGKLIGPWRKLLATTIRSGLMDPKLLAAEFEVATRTLLGWISASYGMEFAHMRHTSTIREQVVTLYIPGTPPQDALDELVTVGKLLGGVGTAAEHLRGNTVVKKLPLSAARNVNVTERIARIMEAMQPPNVVKQLEAAFLLGHTIEFNADLDTTVNQ